MTNFRKRIKRQRGQRCAHKIFLSLALLTAYTHFKGIFFRYHFRPLWGSLSFLTYTPFKKVAKSTPFKRPPLTFRLLIFSPFVVWKIHRLWFSIKNSIDILCYIIHLYLSKSCKCYFDGLSMSVKKFIKHWMLFPSSLTHCSSIDVWCDILLLFHKWNTHNNELPKIVKKGTWCPQITFFKLCDKENFFVAVTATAFSWILNICFSNAVY